MSEIRVLIAFDFESDVLRAGLRASLEQVDGVEVVDEVYDHFDMLMTVGESLADVVIHVSSDHDDTPSIYTHLFEEFPSLKVVRLTADLQHAWMYERPLVVSPLSTAMSSLISAIRTESHTPVRSL